MTDFDEGARIVEMFKVHKTEGHDSVRAPVDGCTFCTYRMEELPLTTAPPAGTHNGLVAYWPLDH